MIIRSIRHKGLKRFVESNDARGLQADMLHRVRNIMAALILSDDLNGFVADAPPGWHIHKLTGDRKNVWTVRVTGNWRITFEARDDEIYLLNIEDYH